MLTDSKPSDSPARGHLPHLTNLRKSVMRRNLTQPDKSVLVFPMDAANITELKKASLLKGVPKTLPQIFALPR
jgi:hypothetical protein